MKVRNKMSGQVGNSDKFNTHACSELIVCFPDGDCSSEFIADYDVYLESTQAWEDMQEALQENKIIPDNYNTTFREPVNEAEMEKGFF